MTVTHFPKWAIFGLRSPNIKKWLEVELAACEANWKLGKIPDDAIKEIREKASFNSKRILEIESEVRHDVIAFLTNVNEYVGDAGRFIHVGLTSSDVLDTGLALQLKASIELLINEIKKASKFNSAASKAA